MTADRDNLLHARTLVTKEGQPFLARPMRHGEARTVMALFGRLGEKSRRARFNGPKPCLSRSELRRLASVDATHQALVAYVEDDPRPIAIARLARSGDQAEIAFAVADEYQSRGIGSALAAQLIADARAAGITKINALVARDNSAAIAVLRRIATKFAACFEGSDLFIEAGIT
jgi:ribosomal protein S18 acetylase RimI-like enzyme